MTLVVPYTPNGLYEVGELAMKGRSKRKLANTPRALSLYPEVVPVGPGRAPSIKNSGPSGSQ